MRSSEIKREEEEEETTFLPRSRGDMSNFRWD